MILGDYTLTNAQGDRYLETVVGQLRSEGRIQSYVIDPTDVSLGYDNTTPDAQGRPRFNGDYTAQDRQGGVLATKPDGSPRKFYEASLNDAVVQALVSAKLRDPNIVNWQLIHATLHTNHALAGNTEAFALFGAMVSRDEALNFRNQFDVKHDIRLRDASLRSRILLPMAIARPELERWDEQ